MFKFITHSMVALSVMFVGIQNSEAFTEGRGGGYAYAEVIKVAKESQNSLVKKLNVIPVDVFERIASDFFKKPIQKDELAQILSALQLNNLKNTTRADETGVVQLLSMDYGVDASGEKYIEALQPFFDIAISKCDANSSSCTWMQEEYLHEALHHFGYDEDEAKSSRKDLLGMVVALSSSTISGQTITFNRDRQTEWLAAYTQRSIQMWAFRKETSKMRATVNLGSGETPSASVSFDLTDEANQPLINFYPNLKLNVRYRKKAILGWSSPKTVEIDDSKIPKALTKEAGTEIKDNPMLPNVPGSYQGLFLGDLWFFGVGKTDLNSDGVEVAFETRLSVGDSLYLEMIYAVVESKKVKDISPSGFARTYSNDRSFYIGHKKFQLTLLP